MRLDPPKKIAELAEPSKIEEEFEEMKPTVILFKAGERILDDNDKSVLASFASKFDVLTHKKILVEGYSSSDNQKGRRESLDRVIAIRTYFKKFNIEVTVRALGDQLNIEKADKATVTFIPLAIDNPEQLASHYKTLEKKRKSSLDLFTNLRKKAFGENGKLNLAAWKSHETEIRTAYNQVLLDLEKEKDFGLKYPEVYKDTPDEEEVVYNSKALSMAGLIDILIGRVKKIYDLDKMAVERREREESIKDEERYSAEALHEFFQ